MSESATDDPFLLEIEMAIKRLPDLPGDAAVCGRRIRGTAHVGDMLEIVGRTLQPVPVRLVAIEQDSSAPFYHLLGAQPDQLVRGQVLAAAGSIAPTTMCRAALTFDEHLEHILKQPEGGVIRYTFYIREANVLGWLLLPEGMTTLQHNDHFVGEIIFDEPLALEVGLAFGIGKFLAQGVVTEVIG